MLLPWMATHLSERIPNINKWWDNLKSHVNDIWCYLLLWVMRINSMATGFYTPHYFLVCSFPLLLVFLVWFSPCWETVLPLKCTLITFLIHRNSQFYEGEIWLDFVFTYFLLRCNHMSSNLFRDYGEVKLFYHSVSLFLACILDFSSLTVLHTPHSHPSVEVCRRLLA